MITGNQVMDLEGDESVRRITRFGFQASMIAFLGILGYSIAQILQIVGVLKFPWDAILIYGFSLCIPTPFLLAMLALHYRVDAPKRFWTHAAILLSVIYTVYVSLNYVVQLATVIPATLRGAAAEIRILDQTPHSLFWDVDALGYIYMGLATLFAAQVFARKGPDKWLRYFFLANGWVVPLISVVYFYPVFSTGLLLLGSPWIVTATGSLWLLMLHFRREASL
jgi:hypothetical protein